VVNRTPSVISEEFMGEAFDYHMQNCWVVMNIVRELLSYISEIISFSFSGLGT
jgi:hypothetical protein